MEPTDYKDNIRLLKQAIIEKVKDLESISDSYKEQISLDSQLFEQYNLLPDFKKIYDKDYLNSLFHLRNLVERDILVSDLTKLEESKKNGMLESYLENILYEHGNCAVSDPSDKHIQSFYLSKNEINKFYICNERITFFSGVSFYFERDTKKLYEYSKINGRSIKLGELILSNISIKEAKLRLKNSDSYKIE